MNRHLTIFRASASDRQRAMALLLGFSLCMSMAPRTGLAQVMIGAYLPGDGWSPTKIEYAKSQLAKPLAFINIFSGFSHSWRQLWHQCSNIAAQGAVPMISWMPIDSSRPSENILPEIVDGSWDAYLEKWMLDLGRWLDTQAPNRRVVMLRFAHEFNGTWYSYGNDPEGLVAAWRYIHQRFEQAGLNDHVEWVWSANYVDVDSHRDMTLYYPGFDYVNWTSLDGYNWGSNYTWTRWKTFTEIFSSSYQVLVDHYPSKPILIAEVASTEPADLPNPRAGQNGSDADADQDKSAWHADLWRALEQSFPAVRAITLFNHNKELSWSITDDGSTGLTAVNNALQSDYFSQEYLTTLSAAESLSCDATSQAPLGAALAFDDAAPRVINRVQQRKHARLTRPPPADQRAEQQGFASMSVEARQQLAGTKLTLLFQTVPIELVTDLQYRAYEFAGSAMPDLTAMTPDEVGTIAEFRLPDHLASGFILRYTGALQVNLAASYTLQISSDNLTEIDIDGVRLSDTGVENGSKRATVFLEAGRHDIELVVLDTGSQLPLSLNWAVE